MDSRQGAGRGRPGSLESNVVAYAKRKREEEGDEGSATLVGSMPGGQGTTLPGADIDLDMIEEDLNHLDGETLEKRRLAMAEFDRKRLARTIAVPTNDAQVRESLRKHGEPVCLFGEVAVDRRDRLRVVLSKLAMAQRGAEPQSGASADEADDDDESEELEEFYTEGSQQLLEARREITRTSIQSARARLERQREDCQVDLAQVRRLRQDLVESLKTYTVMGSQMGDDRPLSRIVFLPDCRRVLTGAWSGAIKLWDIPSCTTSRLFRGHTDRIGGLSVSPHAGRGENTMDFASGAADNDIHLWSLNQDTPIGTLRGHQSRVIHVDHHPTGAYLGSASYDGSWRLWDLATEQELLLQEGHSREVFALRFQCDGALVATAGLDGIGRVWDLRSGRSIMALEGHAKEIFGVDWSPNGYQIATGSADNTVRIFDLRKLTTVHQIPAHKSMVTDVRFFHASRRHIKAGDCVQQRLGDGQYLVSAANDGLINIWTAGDWKLQKSLAGHTGKVLGVDIASDGSYIASAGFDKTFKLWAADDL
ncbi:hypothetical protein GGF46_004972 [Coemansia sp. RSA 552]|nr:hypothetical protein GGF46_004972 [Coemansia sp. RSA 552]